ncbi:pyridoxal phosphate-dependent aminotransferase, partial [Thermodesulfobacteriota bacterium]
GYMSNLGYPFARKAVAEFISKEQGVDVTEDEVIMTCGAAGALNVIFKAILDLGDEVLCPSPFFVEYRFYADNHGGLLKTVHTLEDFTLDLEAITAAIGPKTKAVLLNSPNNPTGQIYSEESLRTLGNVLRQRSRETGKTIYLIADEPYRKIVFDGLTVPSVLAAYEESLVATSYSKDLSIPGERIGFLAVHPRATHKDALLGAMGLTNRILGFVNASALMQRVVASIQGVNVDIRPYAENRDILCKGLARCGYSFVKPAGAFYLFPRSPIPDDAAFVQALREERILVVPGSGFGGPGHFRIAFCVERKTIEDALPGFKRALSKVT